MFQTFSFAEFAEDDILQTISSTLICETHKDKLARCMELFHERLLIKRFGFEMPLAGARWTDLLFAIPLSKMNLDALVQLKQLNGKWCDFSSCIDRISTSGFLNSEEICSLWLELDIGSQNVWPPAPNFFLEIFSHRDMFSQVKKAYQFVKNSPLPPKMASQVQQFLQEGFKIIWIGFMLGRPSNALRIAVQSSAIMSISDYTSYLADCGCHHFNPRDLALLERIRPFLKSILLEIDIDEDGILPKIGWSIFAKDTQEGWKNFLSHLIEEKLADSQKVDALLSWRGNGLLHPEILLPSLFARKEQNREYINRGISHVKLSTAPDLAPSAKIYFGVEKVVLSVHDRTRYNPN